MVNSIQKLFHTDRWWGKTILTAFAYTLYWGVFYGSWFLIPYNFFYDRNIIINPYLFIGVFALIIPAISFLIPKFFKKVFTINYTFLYCMHVFLILLSLILFVYVGLNLAFSHFSIG